MDKSELLAHIYAFVSYLASFAVMVLGFLDVHGVGFGVLFAGVTCYSSWRYHANKIKNDREELRLKAECLEDDYL